MSNVQNEYQGSMEPAMEKLRKELRATRIFSMISSILMVCILVCGFMVCQGVKPYVEQLWPVVEQLAEVDFAGIANSLQSLETSVNAVDWKYLSQQVSRLDVDAINEAIAGLDTEELSKGLENINKAAESLQKMSDSLKAFSSKFGF